MCKVMEDMRNDVEQRTEYKTNIEAIKNIMEGFKVTSQQAMDVLKIPVSEQSKYLERL